MASWDNDPIAKPGFGANDPYVFDIDWSQPVDVVRAKVAQLPPEQREDALRQWADAFVARERKEGGLGQNVSDAVRTLSRGTFLGSWLDEANAATAAAQHAVGLGGAPYDESVAYQRARDRAFDAEHPVLSATGQIVGGLAGGAAAIRAPGAIGAVVGGPLGTMAPAATSAGRIAQAGGTGAVYGAAHGAGAADPNERRDGDETSVASSAKDRAEGAIKGGALGAALGTILGGGIETVKAANAMRSGWGRTGAYDRFGRQLPDESIDTFANQVATGATRNNRAEQRRVLDILGEEMERTGGNQSQAMASTVARLRRQHGVSPQDAQDQIERLLATHRNNPLMMAEYPTVAPGDATLRASRNAATVDPRDVTRLHDSGAHMIFDDLANQAGQASNATVRNAIAQRNAGMQDIANEALDRVSPRLPGTRTAMTIEDTPQLIEGARRLAQMEYRRAGQGPTNNALLTNLLPRILDRHLSRANGRMGEHREALMRGINEFVVEGPGGAPVRMGPARPPTLQMVQDARGALRGMIRKAEQAGDANVISALQPLYRDVTRLMERANPAWRVANRRWADMELDRVGQQLGDAFASKAGPQFRQQLAEFQRLAPEAQDIVRVHFLQKFRDSLDNLGDTHDVAKLFAKAHVRNALREMFGAEAMLDVTRMARDAATATRSARMTAGSQTHFRGQRAAESGAETNLQGALDAANVHGVRNAILGRLTSIATERKNIPLSQIATTPMSEVPEVARHIHNMRTARQYRERLSRPTLTASKYAGPISGEAADPLAEPRYRRPLQVTVGRRKE